MKLTTEHSASSYGVPVFLDDCDELVDYAEGLRQLRKEKNWNVKELAGRIGVSPRTIEGWEQGRMPSKSALILLSKIL